MYKRGFTIIQFLIFLVIFGAVISAVYLFLNPKQKLIVARDSRRQADISSLVIAIRQYVEDHHGALPPGLTSQEQQLGSCSYGGQEICPMAPDNCLNWGASMSAYLPLIPKDPKIGNNVKTGYTVQIDKNQVITARACGAENGSIILTSQ